MAAAEQWMIEVAQVFVLARAPNRAAFSACELQTSDLNKSFSSKPANKVLTKSYVSILVC